MENMTGYNYISWISVIATHPDLSLMPHPNFHKTTTTLQHLALRRGMDTKRNNQLQNLSQSKLETKCPQSKSYQLSGKIKTYCTELHIDQWKQK
jgi:hypothetical protein